MTARRTISTDELIERARREPTLLVPTVAPALGYGENGAYAAIKAGTFPVRTVHIGRRVRVVSADLLRYLGLDRPP